MVYNQAERILLAEKAAVEGQIVLSLNIYPVRVWMQRVVVGIVLEDSAELAVQVASAGLVGMSSPP